MNKTTRGGARPNAGRPTVAEPAKNRTIRLTDADWVRLKAAGGAQWVVLMLDKEQETH